MIEFILGTLGGLLYNLIVYGGAAIGALIAFYLILLAIVTVLFWVIERVKWVVRKVSGWGLER